MFNLSESKIHVALAALAFTLSALGSASGWAQTESAKLGDSQKDSLKKVQKDLDMEHNLVQTDGAKHPREVLKK